VVTYSRVEVLKNISLPEDMCESYSETPINHYPPARRRIQEIRILNAVELAERETSMARTHVLERIRERKQPLAGNMCRMDGNIKMDLK
jgi:hypothetical protein